MFKDIQKRYSPRRRPFNAWLTCATVRHADFFCKDLTRHAAHFFAGHKGY